MPSPTTMDPVIQPIAHFAGSRDHAAPTARLQAVIRASHALRADLLDQASVPFFRSIDLIRVPYPTRYALRDACSLPSPYVHILNRMFIVQFPSATGLKTLLVSPSDVDGNRATPFFRRLGEGFGPVQKPVQALIAPVIHTVDQALAKVGISRSRWTT